MRWPLKNQVLFRMLFLVLITIGAITLANIRSAILVNRAREQDRIGAIRKLLDSTRFSLTHRILENMKGLSGVEFVVVDQNGDVASSTLAAAGDVPPNYLTHDMTANGEGISRQIKVDGRPYYHDIVRTIQAGNPRSPVADVHLLVPQQSEWSIWFQASKSPLLIAALIMPLAILVSLALSNQVTRPLARLRKQVQEIAEGDMREIPPSSRDDEIRDLNLSINEMAIKLLDHEKQLRQSERLRTMAQFGNGIAHHLRNSATGCQLALELFANESQSIAESENFQVANRQLGLINNYINKFLLLLKSSNLKSTNQQYPDEAEACPVDLNSALERVAFLLQPSAMHLDVRLTVSSNCQSVMMEMLPDDADQMMINLISNAIKAASEFATTSRHRKAVVHVDLSLDAENRVLFSVIDNGPGPAAEIVDDLYQPFVSGSSEGIGLGLSLVHDIASRTGGTISWERIDDMTQFKFEFGSNPIVGS